MFPSVELIDPDMEQMAHAWKRIAGYELESTMLAKLHATVWAWPMGDIGTNRGNDKISTVHIRWVWNYGTLNVTS